MASESKTLSEYFQQLPAMFGVNRWHLISFVKIGSNFEHSKRIQIKINFQLKFFNFSSFGANAPLSTINSIIKFVTRRMTDKSQLEALKKFDDKELKEGRTLKQAIEVAEANISWLNKNQEKILNWLRENSD